MTRRASLPGAAELFRTTGATSTGTARIDEPPVRSVVSPARERRGSSGRERHDEKITVYVSAQELLDLESAGGTLVVDYSAGMTKKVALAAAMVHAPRVLVLDEPFESVDPVSAANIRDILHGYVESGGTVIVSSHVMDLVERMCDHVAVITAGRVVAAGTVDEVRAGSTLEDRFVELVGGRRVGEGPEWLRHS